MMGQTSPISSASNSAANCGGPVYDSFHAVGGAGARNSRRSPGQLILILSDVNMPGMSGLDLLLKARRARPDVPVIMITAYCDAETRREAVKRGAADLFTKPIDLPELRVVIDRRIEAAKGPA